MQRLVPAKTMSEMDRKTIEDFGLKSLILMETAGRETALHIRRLYEKELFYEKKRVLVLCGTGNNGGDGWVIARHLLNWGIGVSVLFLGKEDKLSQDSLVNRTLYEKAGGEVFLLKERTFHPLLSMIRHAGLFVDALFGLGLDREITGTLAELIQLVNDLGKPLVSVDLPSGIHADTGQILGKAFRADHTLTFGFAKPGLFLEPGRSLRGKLHIVDIGIPTIVSDSFPKEIFLSTESWARSAIKKRNPDSHKGNFGHLLLIAGAPATRGAAVLAAIGALRAGCGRLTLAVPEKSLPLPKLPGEIMVSSLPGNAEGFSDEALPQIEKLAYGKTLVAAGPGMGLNEVSAKILDLLLGTKLPLVLDADALTLLSEKKSLSKLLSERKEKTILTPHPGEMARLCGKSTKEIAEDAISIAKDFSIKTKSFLLLKGSASISTCPKGICRINSTGNSGMATGGSGDVLCGILASLVAQGFSAERALPLAAFIHGMAADHLYAEKGPWGYLPSEVADCLPKIFAKLLSDAPSHE